MTESRYSNQRLRSLDCANERQQSSTRTDIGKIRSRLIAGSSAILGLGCVTSLGMLGGSAIATQEFSIPIDSQPYDTGASYSAPSYSAPESYSAPSYSAPSYSAPSYSAPSYSAPSYSAPEAYSAPSGGYGYSSGGYDSQSGYYSTPAPAPAPAPDYQAPTGGYSYSAPEPYYPEPAATDPPSVDRYYAEPPQLEIPTIVPPPSKPIELPTKEATIPPENDGLVLPGKQPVATPPVMSPQAENSNVEPPGNNYIDQTEYNIGATGGYQSPDTVIFSERTTGCEFAVGVGGGVPDGACLPVESPAYTADGNYLPYPPAYPPAIAGDMGGSRNPLVRNSNSINNNNVYVGNDNSYAGNSYYGAGGGTWQSAPAPAPQWYGASPSQVPVAGLSPIQVGPVSVSGMSNSGMSYYNRTMRPPAVPGNNDTNLLFPLSIPAPITSLFGWRNHPILGIGRFHTGIDIGADTGTPVVASYSGQVTIADWLGGYGLAVIVDHKAKSHETLYAHLSELFVQPGEWVKQGEVIGRVGSTGMSTGPHLHFELRKLTSEGWVAVNPQNELEFALAQLLNTMRSAELPPQSFIAALPQETFDANTGSPKLPPLPPGIDIIVPNLEPPTVNFGFAENIKSQQE
ncbi:peptidoglycan DD-metalloendopeptidase family protein [Capilliphycus salinus ALCB114379]|uniref:M23 family metallopeptidase n=1 Tax=Capilliphycus salinus TaxID=2768948 RepID=UPI0039A6280E